ncbi:MAG: carboxypeptidase-like regulatory domain-containing protein, partial [Candidatus Saccharicenans sp.]
MKKKKTFLIVSWDICLSMFLFFLVSFAGFAQYREYHLLGMVVDTNNNPLSGVDITLQDLATSRNYRVKTDKNGKYVLSGLPHGHYQVTVKKDGYET